MKTRKWIVITVLVLALSVQTMPVGAAPSASITITPPLPNPVSKGSEVSFGLIISVIEISPGVSGADIYLAYDDTLVAPLPSPNNVVEPLPDFFGSSNVTWYELLPKDKCPGGTYACIHLVAAGPAQVTHSGAAARFHFLAKERGKACFWTLSSTLANKDGFLVNHTPPEKQCVTIDGDINSVIGTALRQGTPANPNPGGGTLACSSVGPVFTDQSGKFKFNVPNGTYPVQAEYSGYLASVTTVTLPPSKDLGTTELCGGDVNDDDKINILDIGTIISKFGKTGVDVRSDLSAPPVFPADCLDPDEPADINDDSLINISDLAIAAGNWNKVGPTPWRTDQCDP
jgi:hypothetical protein